MPLPRRDLEFDPMLLLAGRPQLPSTAMESFKATVQDPTLRPTQLLGMHAERERLAGNGWLKRLGEQTAKFHTGQPLDPEPTLSPKQKELLDPDRVKEDFGHLGLSYDRPTPRGVVEFDAKTKQAEMRRAEILENAPSGIIGSLARFGVGFAGSVADPINLASGVIPVFGGVRATAAARSALTTRFTQTMRPSLARAGARAVEGTAAGFVGSVAVEPAIYGLSRQLQLDYDMTDSLLNVTFGTALGGGLHVGGGFVSDVVTRKMLRSRIGRFDAIMSDAERAAFGEDLKALPDLMQQYREGIGNRAMREAMLGPEPAPRRAFFAGWFEGEDTRTATQSAATINASPQAVEGAMRGAVAQTLQGREVNIAPIFEVDRSEREASLAKRETIKQTISRPEAPAKLPIEEMEERAVSEAVEETMADWKALKERGRGRPPKDDPLAPQKEALASVGISPEMTERQARAQATRVAIGRTVKGEALTPEERRTALAPHAEAVQTMGEGRSDWADYAAEAAYDFEAEPPKEQWTEAEAEELDLAAFEMIEQEVMAARDTEALEAVPEIERVLAGRPETPPSPEKPAGPGRPPAAPQAPPVPKAPTPEGKVKPYSAKASDSIPAGQVGPDGEAGVFEFDASKLEVDAKRFQFKAGGDEFGVSDKLKHVKTFSRAKAGQLIVWEGLDGKVYVANGHQRVGLAKRIKAENPRADTTVTAVLYREKDGVTAEQAMVTAAAANIAEGSGSVIDMAKIARLHPEMIGEAMRVSDEKQRIAFDLTQLGDSSFGLVINEVVPYQYAAIVGRFLPDDEVRQSAAMDLLAKAEPPNSAEAESLVAQVREETLSVETQTGLFGEEVIAKSLAIEKSKVAAAAEKLIRSDRRIFNTLVKEGERITAAGNVLAAEENRARAAKAGVLVQQVKALAYRKGPISDALTKAAQEVKEGFPVRTAARGFIDALRRSDEIGGEARGEPGTAADDGPAGATGERELPKGVAPPPEPKLLPRLESLPTSELFVGDRIGAFRLVEALTERLPEGVRARVGDIIAPMGAPEAATGAYDAAHRVLYVTARSLDPVATFRHEEIHALRNLGLFSEEEWGLLATRAGKLDDWVSPKIAEDYRQWYSRSYVEIADVEEALTQEAVARMVEGYKHGVRYGSAIDTIIAKVLQFFEALRNAAKGLGLQTADDVIRRIEQGEIAQRAAAPRDEGVVMAKLVEDVATGREFAASQPARDFDEIYRIAPANQKALEAAGKEISTLLPDTRFETPGLKLRKTAEAKIGRKGYSSTSQLTDVARGMFVAGKPEFGDSVVRELAKRFDVFDEGWRREPGTGYFDRKILVRFDDGMIGEIQIQEPHLTEAKLQKGGHRFYEHMRELPPNDPKRSELVQKQRDLYAEALASAGPEWAPIIEGLGGTSGKAAVKAASDISPPEAITSAESTSTQGPPGSSTAKARVGVQSAGRPSQFTNAISDAIRHDLGLEPILGKSGATTERTAAGEQFVIPGAEKIGDKQAAERKTQGGKKATAPQKDTEGLPLFDDYQTDLLEQLRLQKADATVQKALDLEQPILGVANCMARRG